jgi:hypothetical protein
MLRRRGDTVPKPLVLEERAASLTMLTAVPLMERVRASCDGPLVLVKGPEVARVYPENAHRSNPCRRACRGHDEAPPESSPWTAYSLDNAPTTIPPILPAAPVTRT